MVRQASILWLVAVVGWKTVAATNTAGPGRSGLAASTTSDPTPAQSMPLKSDLWWSLRPLTRPRVPGDGHPIDAFIADALRQAGLKGSAPADGRTLVRRLTFDLHGLPPAPEEVAAFEGSDDPQAWEKLVDQRLASPRYGERWARHWLDTVHFADSHGFEHDVMRPNAWRYRDYVIGSFNRDTTWDRFVREQLAADVFYPEESPLVAALGFLGAGTYDISAAGTAPKSFEYLDRDDLVTQTMSAFVSATANCARCHEHKFDPITQDDYFSLQAVFAGVAKGDVSYDEDPRVHGRRSRWTRLREAAGRRDSEVLLGEECSTMVDAWEAKHRRTPAWEPLVPELFVSAEGTTLERLPDGSIRSGGLRPDTDTFTVTLTTGLGAITAIRLDLLPDETLPKRGPGRADNGNVHLSEFVFQAFAPGASRAEDIPMRHATSDFDQDGFDVGKAVDGDAKTSWAIHPDEGRPHHAVFEPASPVRMRPGSRLVVVLRQKQPGGHLIGRFRLSALNAPEAQPWALPAAAAAALETPAAGRTSPQRVALAAPIVRVTAERELKALPPPARVWAAGRSAVNERGAFTLTEPRRIHVLKRGDLEKPGAEAFPGALAGIGGLPGRFVLSKPMDEGARRAALADWIADARNPLTWRSVVNRVWHYHFGRGLCDTPGDLGRMGGVPSHPELLDWLAAWFRDDAKGSLKALHRLIITSTTYRQSSAHDPVSAAIDPGNRLLWRMNRPRLDADTFRDSILAVSGRLDLRMGGPSIPYFKTRPGAQLTPILDYSRFDWDSPGASRRSIYRLVWRGIADPFLDALDFPDLSLVTPVRSFSVSALQSLALFNNEFVLHHSRRFAGYAENSAHALEDRVRLVFRQAVQRDPSAGELSDCMEAAEQAGLAAVCRAIFNSNEFLFVD